MHRTEDLKCRQPCSIPGSTLISQKLVFRIWLLKKKNQFQVCPWPHPPSTPHRSVLRRVFSASPLLASAGGRGRGLGGDHLTLHHINYRPAQVRQTSRQETSHQCTVCISVIGKNRFMSGIFYAKYILKKNVIKCGILLIIIFDLFYYSMHTHTYASVFFFLFF